MPLTQPQLRAIEIMAEQMERLLPRLGSSSGKPAIDIIQEFYSEETPMGQFELKYLEAIGKSLAPNATYEDGIVTHTVRFR